MIGDSTGAAAKLLRMLVPIKPKSYMATTEAVHDRIEFAIESLTPTQVVLGLGLITLVAVLILFAQEPLVHDATHNFRHTAGVTCH